MKIITIEREYGAGSHAIGLQVAKRLDIELYDRDIIKETARQMGINPENIEHAEEHFSKSDSIIRAITPISFDLNDTIYDYQRDIIIKVAKEGPCIIIGRCAAQILQSQDIDCLKVYLQAYTEYRCSNIAKYLNTTNPAVILKEMKKKDTARNAYFTHYTGKHITDCKNWDLVLDPGVIGFDKCVDIICKAAE